MTHRTRSLLAATAALTLAATGLLTSSPATAGGRHPAPARAEGWVTVATGLDNPRMLSFGPDGALYVAEAGTGGDGACVEGAEGPACFGLSGAVTRIKHGYQRRVLKHLPSLAGEGGNSATGPADVSVGRHGYAVSIGLGNDPAVRSTIGGAGRWLGTLIGAGRWHPRVIADLAGYEARKNPDGGVPDSNPVGIYPVRGGYVAADAGGNDLLYVSKRGRVSTLAVFPDQLVGGIPMQAVPTSVIPGPRGSFFVSQLTGFPFPAGGAVIFQVKPGHAPKVVATGLTNVTDLAWSRGHLYAVQIAGEGGLLAAQGLPMGTLVRVEKDGSHITVAGEFPAPYGVAISGRYGYVTTCSVCAGGGQVIRVPLP